jgi:E3 ubiquitin-protein ligase NRDP1
VTSSTNFNLNTAFCDHPFGFAFYGLGQLRNGSNAAGSYYGKRFKKTGVLGIFLNMDKGELSFSLNGEDFGIAYKN